VTGRPHERGAFDPVGAMLAQIRADNLGNVRGEVASYIPELSSADPGHFGLALAGVAGSEYHAGDSTVPFTIQSISKPFVYALALTDVGVDALLAKVGVEPSGEGFNAISLEPGTGRPANPMINAGAILTASMVEAHSPGERFDRIRSMLSRCAGRELELDTAVYRSERSTGDRNMALAHLMRQAGVLSVPVDEAVDVYFRQCSVLVTAEDLAVMAATLANAGVNPRTGDEVFDPLVTEHVLSVMATCGMYDSSGDWLVRVGLPAKSGVAGGLVAVSPSQFGIGLYSPLLDQRGNSVRGVAASAEISGRFSLHLMHRVKRTAPSFARVDATHPPHPVTGEVGPGVVVLNMHGDIEFTTAEHALLAVKARSEGPQGETALVVDVSNVTACDPVAVLIIEAIADELAAWGLDVVTVDEHGRRLLRTKAEFLSLDDALVFCHQRAETA
jgi:glutaminase